MAAAQPKDNSFVLYRRGPNDCVKPRPVSMSKGKHNSIVEEAIETCSKQSHDILVALSKV